MFWVKSQRLFPDYLYFAINHKNTICWFLYFKINHEDNFRIIHVLKYYYLYFEINHKDYCLYFKKTNCGLTCVQLAEACPMCGHSWRSIWLNKTTDKQINNQTNKQHKLRKTTNKQVNNQNKQTYKHIHSWRSIWLNETTDKQTNKQTNKPNIQTNKQINNQNKHTVGGQSG